MDPRPELGRVRDFGMGSDCLNFETIVQYKLERGSRSQDVLTLCASWQTSLLGHARRRRAGWRS